MNITPTATAPNKYRNDLTAGACYGQLDFTEQPLAAQYVACLGCPVRDLCPVPTPWPKHECCRRGHLWGEKYANGACKACNRAASDDSRQRAEQDDEPDAVVFDAGRDRGLGDHPRPAHHLTRSAHPAGRRGHDLARRRPGRVPRVTPPQARPAPTGASAQGSRGEHMIRPAIRLWLATWRPWTCNLPDATGHPCGTHGYGAATRQEHRLTAHPPLTGRYACAECRGR